MDEAGELVDTWWPAILAVAEELREHWCLSGDQIRTIVAHGQMEVGLTAPHGAD